MDSELAKPTPEHVRLLQLRRSLEEKRKTLKEIDLRYLEGSAMRMQWLRRSKKRMILLERFMQLWSRWTVSALAAVPLASSATSSSTPAPVTHGPASFFSM